MHELIFIFACTETACICLKKIIAARSSAMLTEGAVKYKKCRWRLIAVVLKAQENIIIRCVKQDTNDIREQRIGLIDPSVRES